MNAPFPACWRADDARSIFVTEALEGDDAIFLATHTPIEGFDVAGRDAGEFSGTDENAVLEALADPARQHAFCVVQGEPGSGKSHLIRWLSVNWTESGDIMLLLRRADGSLEGALRQLRDRLPQEFAALFDNLGQRQRASTQGRANIFLSTLANTLEPGHFDVPLSDDAWCRQYWPAELLSNPAIKAGWKGPSRILKLLEGAGGERNSATASFDLYDIQELADLCPQLRGSASIAHSQELARRLEREADTIRAFREQDWLAHELAAEHADQFPNSLNFMDALNLRRNDAIQNVLGVSAQGLKTLFRQVREALAERGQRLVLLLEDITSWEGLDDSLIDVLVFNAAAKGDREEKPICPLISVVGVTPAYYEKLQGNYRQRITHEIRLGQSSGGLQDVATLREDETRRQFAARYLAAVRAGPAALDNWLDEVRAGTDLPPPNKCDTCPRQETCFAVFGDDEGIGLFPFTAHAFDRFFEALKENDNGQTWKTPRGILQAILNPNLSQPESLEAATYPGPLIEPEAFRSDRRSQMVLAPRLEQIVANRIDEPTEQARMRRMLAYWANPDHADTTREGEELAFAGTRRAVYEAFGLPWLGGSEANSDTTAQVQPVGTAQPIFPEIPEQDEPAETPATRLFPARKQRPVVTAPKPKRLMPKKSELEQMREQLRGWNAGGTIENSNRWNALLYALVDELDPRRLGTPELLVSRVVTSDMVKLQGSTSGARDYLVISPAPWVRNGLEAYIALKQDAGMSFADADFHRRNLATMMRHLERKVESYIDRRVLRLADERRWSSVATFTQILLARSYLRGVTSASVPFVEQVRAVLSDEGLSESDFSARCAPWQDWLNSTKSMHEKLRADLRAMVSLGSEGAAGAALTDSSELAGAVLRFAETGKLDDVSEVAGGLPEPFRRARELALIWNEKRTQIERIESTQIKNRSEALAQLLRGKDVATHFTRLDNCISGIAELLPTAAVDRVAAWKQAYMKLRPRLDEGVGSRVEDLIFAIEEEEIPAKFPLKIAWLAQAPARDLEELLTAAQTGEKAVEALRDHAQDCVREASGTGSLADVRAVGNALRAAVAQTSGGQESDD